MSSTEGAGSSILVMDPYERRGTYVQNDPLRSRVSLLGEVARVMDGKDMGRTTSEDLKNRRVHIILTLTEVKQTDSKDTLGELLSRVDAVRNLSSCVSPGGRRKRP